jgi:crotonobetainyl-CoA:carnitine CoA-transferase CaiB-like acyl-CoA transferase
LVCDSDVSLKSKQPKLFAQLHRGKRELEPSLLPQLVETADMLLTDLSHSALSRLSVDAESARGRNERLVYVQLVPRTCLADEEALSSELGPLYSESGMASIFANGGQGLCSTPTPPNRPPQFVLGLMAAQYVLSASTIGLFHAARTGKGVHVVVSALRIGYWKMQYVHSLGQYNPPFMAHEPAIELTQAHLLTPLCTFNCFVTKDGMYVQLLCLDIGRFVMPLLKALGLSLAVWPGLVSKLTRSILFSPKGTPVVLKLMPGFIHMNAAVQGAIGKLTFEELQALFKNSGIWFTRVRMPHQLRQYEQARLSGVFCSAAEDSDGSVFSPVATPIHLSSHCHP